MNFHLKNKLFSRTLIAAALCAALTPSARAGETSTGEMTLYQTRIKSVGAPGEVISLPKCPEEVEVFTDTLIRCSTSWPTCAIEASLSSELSDVTGTRDSVRFKLYVDGLAVAPSTNAGVNSTAHSGQIESSTFSWFKNFLPAGSLHRVEARMCVNDTDGGGASAFAGDRTLVVRSYKGS
jgi:hypothetical protein